MPTYSIRPHRQPLRVLFADRLKQVRQDQKLTQQDLATKTGLKQTAVTAFETGHRTPNIKNLHCLCKALNISADYLLGLKNQ